MSLSERAKAFAIDSILSSTKSSVKLENDYVDSGKPTSHPADFGDVLHDAEVGGRFEGDYVVHPNQGFELNSEFHFNPRMASWRRLNASNSTLFSSTSTLNSASSMTDINFGSSQNLRRSSDEASVALQTSPFGSSYRLESLAVSDDSLSNDVPMILGDLDDDAHPIAMTVNGITATLAQSSMWRKFHECETEMIINRSGRRMFPCFAVSLSGLQPDALYRISVTITSDNRSRYKFINGKWLAVGKADPEMPNEPYEHPLSPNHGLFWESNVVSFAKLKITNNKDTKAKNQIVLHSMHEYTPRLFIERLISDKSPHEDIKVEKDSMSEPSSSSNAMSTSSSPSTWMHMQQDHRSSDPSSSDAASTSTGLRHSGGSTSSPVTSSSPDPRVDQMTCISFPETSFVAVTAYQNDHITQLKIQNNPFAKAFRDAEVAAMLQGANTFPEEHHLLAEYRDREAFSSTHSLNAHMTGQRRFGLPILQHYPVHLGVVPGHHQPSHMTRSLANVRVGPNDGLHPNPLGHDLHWKVSSATNLAGAVHEGALHESCGFLPALSTADRANSDAELSAKPRARSSRSLAGNSFGGLGLGCDGDFRKRAIANLVDDRRDSDKYMLRNPLFSMDATKIPAKKQAIKLYHSPLWLLDSPQIIVSDTAKSGGKGTQSKPLEQHQTASSSSLDDEMSTEADDRDVTMSHSKVHRGIGGPPNAEELGGAPRQLMVPPTPFSLAPHQRHHMEMNGGDLTRRVTIHTPDAFRQRVLDSPVMKPRRSLDSAKMSASLYHFPGSATFSPRLIKRSSMQGLDCNGSRVSFDEESTIGSSADN